MKNLKLSLLIALAAFAVSLSSCKKDDDTKPLKSFSFPTTTNLVVELTWDVNGQTPGYNHADVDLFIDDEVTSPSYSIDYRSSSGSGYESITIGSADANKTMKVGVKYFSKNSTSLTNPYTINYTIKVYPVGNSSAAQTYTGTISAAASTTLIYDQMTLVKSSSTYSFTELATKTTFTQPN